MNEKKARALRKRANYNVSTDPIRSTDPIQKRSYSSKATLRAVSVTPARVRYAKTGSVNVCAGARRRYRELKKNA